MKLDEDTWCRRAVIAGFISWPFLTYAFHFLGLAELSIVTMIAGWMIYPFLYTLIMLIVCGVVNCIHDDRIEKKEIKETETRLKDAEFKNFIKGCRNGHN